ncbi:PHB depolymerase family esterase [Streptomyces sp. NPDC051940]|uniref:alpha/beta hydrolase family esterase n=1 Tax=Streptomyces sp. NPDC051940 TaxID=3155675 RepID=UPI003417495C
MTKALRWALRRPLTSLVAVTLLLLAVGCGGGTEPDDKPRASAKPSKSAAPAAQPKPGTQMLTLDWQGKQRGYVVHAPPGYTPGTPLPLVMVLHYYPGTGTQAQLISRMDEKADAEGFLTVYPDGLDGGFNALICCGAEDDVGFLRELVKQFVTVWHADPTRVYATGISNGGDMSFKLAVELSDTFAAVAPVSGGYSGSATAEASYMPKSPVSVITFIGGQDRYYETFKSGITTWKQRLACKDRGRPAKKAKYTSTKARCKDGSDVVAYDLPAMGHAWPGATSGDLSDAEAGVVATDLIWEFFKQHKKQS